MDGIQDLLDRVARVRARLGISEHPAWYRGHSSVEYKLLPGLFRRKNGPKHERDMFAVFQSEGHPYIPSGLSELELLALMQHFGMPTRLLDWTSALDVALYFAVMATLTAGVGKPCVWVLNPFALNRASVTQNVIFDRADRLDLNYYESAKQGHFPFDLPVAIAAPWHNPRVVAQHGYFTIHGNDTGAIEDTTSRCVRCVEIPPHLVRAIQHHLRQGTTNSYTMFPGLDGLSLKLRRQFRQY